MEHCRLFIFMTVHKNKYKKDEILAVFHAKSALFSHYPRMDADKRGKKDALGCTIIVSHHSVRDPPKIIAIVFSKKVDNNAGPPHFSIRKSHGPALLSTIGAYRVVFLSRTLTARPHLDGGQVFPRAGFCPVVLEIVAPWEAVLVDIP